MEASILMLTVSGINYNQLNWNSLKTSQQAPTDNLCLLEEKEDHKTPLSLFVGGNELALKGNTNLNEGNGLTVSDYKG